ncbi:hypothetical protein RF11_07000 [Thelohanellus kitauei]|uniref:Uncharacterized protein n=1 Tax=Thelohanellus kitauei TaxID=669202 RepID=A0A0C2IJD2_THEKT|nr:hypothetical protein RF11_07000 [Thelohanellus kitauei]
MICERKQNGTIECKYNFVTYPDNKSCAALSQDTIVAKEVKKLQVLQPQHHQFNLLANRSNIVIFALLTIYIVQYVFSKCDTHIDYDSSSRSATILASNIGQISSHDMRAEAFPRSNRSKMMFDKDIYESNCPSIYNDCYKDIYKSTEDSQPNDSIYNLGLDIEDEDGRSRSNSDYYNSSMSDNEHYSIYQPAGYPVEKSMDRFKGSSNSYYE